MSTTSLDLLYAYNEWANARLLGAAARLPTALLTRELGSSYASVWGTLRHIVWAEWRWLGRWQTRAPAGPDPLACQDLAALQHRAGEIASQQRAFLRRLTPVDLERLVGYENPPGTRWTYALGDMVQHLVNHSTYHRGQVAAMLRQLGNAPPATDYLVYLDEGAAGAGPPAPGAT